MVGDCSTASNWAASVASAAGGCGEVSVASWADASMNPAMLIDPNAAIIIRRLLVEFFIIDHFSMIFRVSKFRFALKISSMI
jgi:hypothetical protein